MVPKVCRHFAKWGLEILLNVVVDLGFREGVNVDRLHDSWEGMVLCCQLWTVVQGALWHGSRTKKVTNHESQISNFHFSFESHNQHVKYRFLSCSSAKRKVVKECLKNSSKWRKEKARLQIATYKNSSISFNAFTFFIFLPEFSKLKVRGK